MATTGYFEGAIPTPSNGFNLKVEYSIEQSIVGNYSDITPVGYVKRNNSTYYPYNTTSKSIMKIDKITLDKDNKEVVTNLHEKTQNPSFNLGSDGYKKLFSGQTFRVYHENDGSRTIKLTFSFNGLLSQYYPIGSISQKIELPKINRSSTTLATDFDIGSSISLEVTRYNDAYTHTVVANIGEYSKTILEKSSELKKLAELDADSLYAETSDSDEGIITLTTTTYNGDDVVGTTTSTVKCRVKNSNPTVDNVAITDTSAIVSSNVIVRYLSTARLIITASAKNGASITGYNVTVDATTKSSTSNEIDIGTVTNNEFKVQAVDTRKNTSEIGTYAAANFIPYELPAISNIELVRTSEELNQAKAIIQGRWYAENINGSANKLRLSFRYKKSTEETWSDYINISNSITENEFNIETPLEITGEFDVNSVYNIEVRATDDLTHGELTGTLPKAIPLTDHWEDHDGVQHYNINAKLQILGKELVDVIYPVGSIYMSVNDVNPDVILGGTWERLQDVFLLGSGSHELGETGGAETHTLTIEEMPSHTHPVPASAANSTSSSYSALEHWTKVPLDRSISTNATGGDQPHNNMPPYLVVNMWERTA